MTNDIFSYEQQLRLTRVFGLRIDPMGDHTNLHPQSASLTTN